MVGILVSFWDCLFSGAMLVSGRVYIYIPCESCVCIYKMIKQVVKMYIKPSMEHLGIYAPHPEKQPPESDQWLPILAPGEDCTNLLR